MAVKQLKIRGRILDYHTGRPLKGAKVCSFENLKGETTNKSGKFSINLNEPKSLLTISLKGYQTLSKEIKDKADSGLDISLIKYKEVAECTDLELIEKAKGGNQKAYAKLMDRYYNGVYFHMLKYVRKPEDAEDLTIEAFGKAFDKLHIYRPDFAFSTWLYRVAWNNAIDFKRKKRLQTLSIDEPIKDTKGENITPNIPSNHLDPEQTFVKEQRKTMLHELMGELSPKYRRLIELRFFKEFSYNEIAEEMEAPIGTIKAQLHRAKQLLQAILETKADII